LAAAGLVIAKKATGATAHSDKANAQRLAIMGASFGPARLFDSAKSAGPTAQVRSGLRRLSLSKVNHCRYQAAGEPAKSMAGPLRRLSLARPARARFVRN
jgi:hypothetical protein